MKMGEECPKDWYTEEAIRGWLKREGVPHARDLPRFLAEHFQKALEKGWQLRSSALRAVRAEALHAAADEVRIFQDLVGWQKYDSRNQLIQDIEEKVRALAAGGTP